MRIKGTKNKVKNASKIVKNDTLLLNDNELIIITNSLQKSRQSIRNKIDNLGALIGQQTKLNMYDDMFKYTQLINKINGHTI